MGKRKSVVPASAPCAKKEKADEATTPAKSLSGKKVDPVIAEIQDMLTKDLDLPSACAEMLATVAPMTLGVLKEKRDEQQAVVVQWIDDAMEKHQARLQHDADVAAEKLRGLEASKADLLAIVQKAEVALNEKKDLLPSKKDALAEATIAVTATKKNLAKIEEQRAGDVSKTKELERLTEVLADHFKAPLALGEALHYDKLQPVITGIELEESFKISVSSSCCKTKDQRSSFDESVLEAVEKAMCAHQVRLRTELEAGSADAELRMAEAQKVEAELAVQRRSQETAAAELASAQKEVEAKVAELKVVEEAVAGREEELRTAKQLNDRTSSIQAEFEQGPMKRFRTCRDSTPSIPATAGA